MASINIYLGDDLKDRMDAATDELEVSWSRVAAVAFESMLAEVAARRGRRTLGDTIQRLRASKLNAETDEFRHGRDAGYEWGRNYAEWVELEHLSRLDNDWFVGGWDSSLGVSGSLLEHMNRKKYGGDLRRQEMFWCQETGEHDDPHPGVDFVDGFWHGALDVYEEVKDGVE